MSLPAIVSSAPASPLPGPAGLASGDAPPQDFASMLSAQALPATETLPASPALPTAELTALLDKTSRIVPGEIGIETPAPSTIEAPTLLTAELTALLDKTSRTVPGEAGIETPAPITIEDPDLLALVAPASPPIQLNNPAADGDLAADLLATSAVAPEVLAGKKAALPDTAQGYGLGLDLEARRRSASTTLPTTAAEQALVASGRTASENRTPASPNAAGISIFRETLNAAANAATVNVGKLATLAKAESANLAGKGAEVTPTNTPSGPAVTTTTPQPATNSAFNAPRITTPLHDPQWSQSLGDKVVWLARTDQQTAQISINPPQLGPMQISINLQGDQATAVFASPHAEVRQAIEDALPRLREMLSGAGITLGDANVGAQLQQQQRETPAQFAGENRGKGENGILAGNSGNVDKILPTPLQRGRGLVDLFA
jgi:flagellar hook-length control protein FliK